MASIVVAGVSIKEGKGKESGKYYKMMNVKVIATDNEGVVEVGEITFFERDDQPLPKLEPGKKYDPVYSHRAKDGKIYAEISSLVPASAAAQPMAKAA